MLLNKLRFFVARFTIPYLKISVESKRLSCFDSALYLTISRTGGKQRLLVVGVFLKYVNTACFFWFLLQVVSSRKIAVLSVVDASLSFY